MSDKPEPTADEKIADSLPANAKYVAAHRIAEEVYWEGRASLEAWRTEGRGLLGGIFR